MQNAKKNVDWNEYLDKYIDFINAHDVQYFFELDIDAIVGYERVKQLRKDSNRKRRRSAFQFGTRAEVLRNSRDLSKCMTT